MHSRFEYQRERRRKLAIEGRCLAHPKFFLIPGQKTCLQCKERNRADREKREALGVCKNHPQKEALKDRRICLECQNEGREKRKQRYSEGFCHSHPKNKLVEGRTTCLECIERKKQNYNERRTNGFCVYHPLVQSIEGLSYCIECRINQGYNRLSQIFGFTKETYLKECKKRDSKCELCDRICLPVGDPSPKKNKSHKFHVDHDHQTGKIRGLLCQQCNHLLGLINEDILTLKKIAKRLPFYLSDANPGIVPDIDRTDRLLIKEAKLEAKRQTIKKPK